MNELSSSLEPLFAKPAVSLEKREDGSMIMRSLVQAKPPAQSVGQWLRDWADKSPDNTFVAERPQPGDDWVRLSYAAVHQNVRAIASWVLHHGLSAKHPLVILSDNSLGHALLALGVMYVGVPVATLSPAYSLMSSDHQKLCAMIKLLEPGAIYFSDAQMFEPALKAIEQFHEATLITSGVATAGARHATPFSNLLASSWDSAVDAALCVPKIRFCNIGGEGRRGRAVT
jgi:feruloyl-CoA synthase